ncbi:MAG: hypothetical protein SFU27_10285, partial [Thermonemataceae bacterium]|nr:hypothetical protein [Thermonemataceae bacterium]
YYFAATAYITSNQHTYTLLKNSLKLYSSVELYYFYAIDHSAIDKVHKLFLQNYLWTFDVKKISEDAIKLNFDNPDDKKDDKSNWQLSLSYGRWYFDNSAISEKESFLEFPRNMGAWNLSCARFLSENLSVNVNLGMLIKTIKPPRPSVSSVFGGANVEVEGGGIFLVPISIGMDYFFTKQRFRPYGGFGFGIVPATYKYIEASGNLANGINRNEYKFKSNAPFAELSAGFMYNTGENFHLGLNFDYIQSKDFTENIGGYNTYNGFKIAVLFSFVF